MTAELIPPLLAVVFLLLASGFFSGCETALFSLNPIERRRILEKHPFIGKTVDDLLNRPRRTLITILIGNMVVNTLATVVVTLVALQIFEGKWVGFIVAVFFIVLLFFGEVLPKVIAIRNNVLIAEINAVFLNLIAKFIFPIRFVVRKISDLFLSVLIRDAREKTDLLSENELKALVRIGEEEGVLKKEEVRMICRLIDLGVRQVKQIMTPKTDLVAFDVDEGPEALIRLIQKSHFTYIPVYESSMDNLLGVISTQEFMLSQKNEVRSMILLSDYVPETKRIDELLTEFRLKGKQFAICVDEYGSVSGLITFEDIIEEVFGEFHDEYAHVESLFKEIRKGEYSVQAKISLRELNELLGIHLKSDSSETLNGWLLEKIGRIPNYNEQFSLEGLQFQVVEVFKNRIHKVYIRKRP